MRSELKEIFLTQARSSISPVAVGLGLEWADQFEPPWAEAACDFSSMSHRLRVTLGNGHLATVDATLARIGPRRWFRGRKLIEFGCGNLAEALGLSPLDPLPVRKPDDLVKELNRLADWLRSHGEKLVSADDASWQRAHEIAKQRTARKLKALRDPQACAGINDRRREAEAAYLRGDSAALVAAYEDSEDWLVPSEREMLESARQKIAES